MLSQLTLFVFSRLDDSEHTGDARTGISFEFEKIPPHKPQLPVSAGPIARIRIFAVDRKIVCKVWSSTRGNIHEVLTRICFTNVPCQPLGTW